ncbi:retrovirus-related Pol polyprotein from transposon 412 [Trichonephila clavipes]|nr:retrovirus-related Pol polyprotein from transposon 412 [Trichonephila clavipes]
MDPTKLSKNKMLLTGIGEAQVTTIGSFEHEFKIDDENYSLTWHFVPTDKLKFEAVIGSDLLEQASISFTKERVKFNKYENHAQLMQISAENLQEELDLRHVENRQIKKELEKLIQDYKPEKTASTDVTMRIILKDEEPVSQPPRRLAFTERQEVNKQIEEWLNEGIIRPSSAEYASPIVMVKKKDGSSRMCIDYRKLNQKLMKDKFPLPIIEDVLDTLQEAKVYSTLDLCNDEHFTKRLVKFDVRGCKECQEKTLQSSKRDRVVSSHAWGKIDMSRLRKLLCGYYTSSFPDAQMTFYNNDLQKGHSCEQFLLFGYFSHVGSELFE